MATTARIPEPLKGEAEAYARALGISLNALLAVALRDYLDARAMAQGRAIAPPSVPTRDTPQPQAEPAPAVPDAPMRKPKSPRSPCPCGSGEQWRYCHGRSKIVLPVV